MLTVMVYNAQYHNGRTLVPMDSFDSAQPLVVYNKESGAPDDNDPAEYTYPRSGRTRMPLPNPPFPVSSLPPQVRPLLCHVRVYVSIFSLLWHPFYV